MYQHVYVESWKNKMDINEEYKKTEPLHQKILCPNGYVYDIYNRKTATFISRPHPIPSITIFRIVLRIRVISNWF